MKIHPVRAELFNAERQDRTNLTVAFHNLRKRLTTGRNAAVKIDNHNISSSIPRSTCMKSYIYMFRCSLLLLKVVAVHKSSFSSPTAKELTIIRKVRKCELRQTWLEPRVKGNIHFIIIIRHEIGLDRPVSVWSNCLFIGLPSRLRPFGLIQHYFWYPVVQYCYMSWPIWFVSS